MCGFGPGLKAFRWQKGNAAFFSSSDGILPGHTTSVEATRGGQVWFATTQGRGFFDGRRFHAINPEARVGTKLAASVDGGMWAVQGLRLMHYRADGGKEDLADLSWLDGARQVSVMHEDRLGNLWIGTREYGLFRFVGRRAEPVAEGSYRSTPDRCRAPDRTVAGSAGIYTNAAGGTHANNWKIVGNGGYYRDNAGTDTLSGAVTGNELFDLRVNSTGIFVLTDMTASGTFLQTGNSVTTANLGSLTGVAGTTLKLSGTNTFTSGTNIDQGMLNAVSTSALGAGNVTIGGGKLPLNASGVDNLTGIVNFTQNTGSTNFDIASLVSFDSIASTGAFSINGGTIFLPGTLVGDGTDSCQIFSGFTGNTVGVFLFDTTGLTNLAGRTATLSSAGTLTFTAVPEPSVYGLFTLGLLGVAIVIRRRRAIAAS